MTPRRTTSLSERIYAAFLLAYPRDFRRVFGVQMRDFFRDQLHEARAGAGEVGVLRLWLRAIPDLVGTGIYEHAAALRARRYPAALAKQSSTAFKDPMYNTFLQDARFAGRMLLKNPVFTLVAVAVVALGTGAVSTIFSVANAVILQPLPGVTRPSELVNVERTRSDGRGSLSASYPYYESLAGNSKTMAGIAAWTMVQLTVSTGGEGTTSLGNIVSGNYFDVLGVRPALGRFFAGDEINVQNTYPVVVISYDFWQRRFAGDSAVVGRAALFNGTRFTVIGVAPPRFRGVYPVLRTDAWIPLMMQQQVRQGGNLLNSDGSAWLEMFGRLAPGVTAEAAAVELSALTRQRATGQTGEGHHMREFTGARLSRATGLPSDVATPVLAFFVVLLVLSGLVLLIASVNVASMLLARAVARRREIAVRIALGAGRARLIRQLLTESVMLFVIGGAAGVALSVLGTRLISQIQLPVDVPLALDLSPDARVTAVTLVVALLTGIVFGLAPALNASRLDLSHSLRGDSAGAGRVRSRLRTALVVGQVAMSLLLLTTSGLFIRALDRGHRVDIGLDVTHVATTALNASLSGYDSTRGRQLYATLRDRLAALPGVTHVSYARVLPLSMNTSGTQISVPGYTPQGGHAGEPFDVVNDIVDYDYFGTIRTPMVRGRDFARTDDQRSARVAVINEAFAQEIWPGQDAVGRAFLLDSATITVVGVVHNSKFSKLDERPVPFMYLPLAQHFRADVNLLVRTTGDAALLAAPIRSTLHALDRTLPAPTITTLQQSTAVMLLPQRMAVAVTGALGFAGLLLAAIGLYGVISFSTIQRTREIGVRIALGAARRDVLGLVVGEGMRLVGIGMAIGLVLAVAATRALTPFLFGVSPLDLLTFVAIAITLGGTSFLASYLPARRAAALDPVLALRQE